MMEDRIGQLKRVPLFSTLPAEDIHRIAELAEEMSLRPRSTLYRQGQLDPALYVVVSGRLRVSARDERGRAQVLKYLEAGDSFGERSLLTGDRRDVTIDAEQATYLLSIEKGDFDRLLQQYPHMREALSLRKLQSLSTVHLFEDLESEDLRRVAAVMGRTRYRRGAMICHKGEISDTLFVIESGRVAVLARQQEGKESIITHLRAGDFFGGRSLLTGEPRDTSVQALEDTSLFYANKRDFDRVLRGVPSMVAALNLEAQARETIVSQRFPWQREGEVLAVLSRKHAYALFRRLWVLIFPFLALGAILAGSLTFDWTGPFLYALLGLVGLSVPAVVAWLYTDWRNDYYVVTNKRVVHVEKTILLQESRDEAPLESIQDIFILMPSIVGRLVGFNDLTIQTAGAKGQVVFRTLGHASWVRDRIFEQLERIEEEERAEDRGAIRDKLKLELGLAEEDTPSQAELGRVHTAAESGVSPQAPSRGSQLTHVLRAFRSYVVPEMRLEESGVVTWRKHWFRLIEKIAGSLLLVLIMIQLGLAVSLDLLRPQAGFERWFWTALLVGVAVGLFLIWYRYEDWRNDIYQLTDDRVIDLERLPLGLREERREASLAVIQDIGYEIPGIVANLLDYGNVVIETAGREAAFTFSWVHRPRRVQEEVFARMDAFRERERRRQRERRAHELLDWFATYADLSEEEGGPVNGAEDEELLPSEE